MLPATILKSMLNGSTVYVGNKELFTERKQLIPADIENKVIEFERQGNTTMLVQLNDVFIGIVTVMDVARKDAKPTLTELGKAGIRKMIMLTGDNQKVAEAIAREIGITEAYGNLLPEKKVAAIEKIRSTEKKIAMVGDGVNDAPAMAKKHGWYCYGSSRK